MHLADAPWNFFCVSDSENTMYTLDSPHAAAFIYFAVIWQKERDEMRRNITLNGGWECLASRWHSSKEHFLCSLSRAFCRSQGNMTAAACGLSNTQLVGVKTLLTGNCLYLVKSGAGEDCCVEQVYLISTFRLYFWPASLLGLPTVLCPVEYAPIVSWLSYSDLPI